MHQTLITLHRHLYSEACLHSLPWCQHFLATISRWLLQTGSLVQKQCNWDIYNYIYIYPHIISYGLMERP